MNTAHPCWESLYLPAILGQSQLLRSRYHNRPHIDGEGWALSARAWLAIGDYVKAAECLHASLVCQSTEGILLARQIKSPLACSKSPHLSFTDQQLDLLCLTALFHHSVKDISESLQSLKTERVRETAQQWLRLSHKAPDQYWQNPQSVAQQVLQQRLRPHPRLGGYCEAMVGYRPIRTLEKGWAQRLRQALYPFQEPWFKGDEDRHRHQCSGQ